MFFFSSKMDDIFQPNKHKGGKKKEKKRTGHNCAPPAVPETEAFFLGWPWLARSEELGKLKLKILQQRVPYSYNTLEKSIL